MNTFAIKLGNIHPTSLCDELRCWRQSSSLIIGFYVNVSREAICEFVRFQRQAQRLVSKHRSANFPVGHQE